MKKTKKKNIKKIIIIVIILIIFIPCIKIIGEKIEEKVLDEKEYFSVHDFETLKEVANYLECKLIKEKISKENPYKKDIYMELKLDLYDGHISNQGFFDNLIALIINVEDYNSFKVIDEEKNIIIEVICDTENKTHLKTIINGQEDYFKKMDSKNNLEENRNNTINIIDVNITSPKLKEIIDKKWVASKINLGKKESQFNGYDIFFSEGIEVKVIDEKISNIVFTTNYKDSVINNIKVGDEKSNIIKLLGEPTFGAEDDVIGYKCKDFYMFFSNKNISIYRLEKYEKEDLMTVIKKYEESKNFKELVSNMTDLWYDYDKFEYNENYVSLVFAAKGIAIEAFNKIELPIKIYNNFEYMNEISEFTSVEVINEDLVYLQETNRLNSTLIFPPEEELKRNFVVLLEENEEGLYKADFISIVQDYAHRTLEENINDYIWCDENRFIYSIDYKGIYIVDLRTGKKQTVIEEQEKIDIKTLENSILRYNEKEIEIK